MNSHVNFSWSGLTRTKEDAALTQKWKKMAEGDIANTKSMSEFRRISDEYDIRMRETHETLGYAWLVYMEKHREPIAKRRREIMGTMIDLIPRWREMADHASVVLGTGNMLEHQPLHRIINHVNWPDPDPGSFAVITMELTRLMSSVGKQIDNDAKRAAEDAAKMELELIQHGIMEEDRESAEADDVDVTDNHFLETESQQHGKDTEKGEFQEHEIAGNLGQKLPEKNEVDIDFAKPCSSEDTRNME